MKLYTDYSLLPHNTFGIEAQTSCFIEYGSVSELHEALVLIRTQYGHKPLLHIGGGSNLLFMSDYDGVVLHSTITGIEMLEETEHTITLRVGAGMVWDDFVAWCVNHGYYGVENLSLIPGEVGASAVQNIGAYGVEAKDSIQRVETIELATGKERTFDVSECAFAYRQSLFKQAEWRGRLAVTYVVFRLSKCFTPNIEYGGIRKELERKGVDMLSLTAKDVREVIIEIRERKLPDPKVQGNAGSFFMNPVVERGVYVQLAEEYPQIPHYDVDDRHVKIPAGWLIEQCGWKGKSLGAAGVHDKQALVLVNRGGAVGSDVAALSDAVRADVKAKFRIDIHPEVNFIEAGTR